jgi:hypothetical protein
MTNLRRLLIRMLAGKMPVAMNVTITTTGGRPSLEAGQGGLFVRTLVV